MMVVIGCRIATTIGFMLLPPQNGRWATARLAPFSRALYSRWTDWTSERVALDVDSLCDCDFQTASRGTLTRQIATKNKPILGTRAAMRATLSARALLVDCRRANLQQQPPFRDRPLTEQIRELRWTFPPHFRAPKPRCRRELRVRASYHHNLRKPYFELFRLVDPLIGSRVAF